MKPQRRTELILRLPNLTAEQAATLSAKLSPLATVARGSLSAIERDHFPRHARHVKRIPIVKDGKKVQP